MIFGYRKKHIKIHIYQTNADRQHQNVWLRLEENQDTDRTVNRIGDKVKPQQYIYAHKLM
jgi:hypothetical protein